MSDSVRPHRRHPTKLPRPWDSPGKNTGVGCHFLLQRTSSLPQRILGKVRSGGFRTAWVIGGYANKFEREKLAQDLGAQLIYIAATQDECMKRLNSCNDYRQEHQEEWAEYINKWFESYVE